MKAIKISLVKILPVVNDLVKELKEQQSSTTPPPLLLNKHCAECEFQTSCRKEAISKDDLSLLSLMTKKERDKYHEKGIFSITQLSHTFRPRKKNKHSASKRENYSHALKALSVREQKIHVIGKPELALIGNPVYLDVEGKPDEDFYYLVGMRFSNGEVSTMRSFWADGVADEEKLWISFLNTLCELDNPQLIYYGNYEKIFLEKMRKRYGECNVSSNFLDQLQAKAINLVSILFAQIYFPTYSNSLKEIGRFLDVQWTDSIASGIASIMWRLQWENYKDRALKEKLLTYNSEDCKAIEHLTSFLLELNLKQNNSLPIGDKPVVDVDLLNPSDAFQTKFGKTEFALPEFKAINKAAYWNYQQEKVYFRSHPQRKRTFRGNTKLRTQKLRINKVVDLGLPKLLRCSKCQSPNVVKNGKHYKIVHDIKFGAGSIKRWIVKYFYYRQRCQSCGHASFAESRPWTGSKYGHNLIAYAIYNIIDLQVSQSATAENIQQVFGFSLGKSTIGQFKNRAAKYYKETYEGILQKVKAGKLIHADETRVSLKSGFGYVWVLTSLEEVIYFCTDTREGDKLKEYLKAFKGVLVSDFYSVYDAFDCPQQKCLIHLIRDLNDALHKEPFNQELKEFVQAFASLLKPMIETIDHFGLKTRFLRKHKSVVRNFYKDLSRQEYKTSTTQKIYQRFVKNRDKLFTFLDYDGVPWNNNNAEHAVKAFAALRKPLQGLSTSHGMQEYLELLSISQTCKLRGVSFFDFLK